jgi:hypothetical protein
MGGVKREGRDQRGAVAGEARDAVDTRGLNGFGEGHRWQDDEGPPGQYRYPFYARSNCQIVVIRMVYRDRQNFTFHLCV